MIERPSPFLHFILNIQTGVSFELRSHFHCSPSSFFNLWELCLVNLNFACEKGRRLFLLGFLSCHLPPRGKKSIWKKKTKRKKTKPGNFFFFWVFRQKYSNFVGGPFGYLSLGVVFGKKCFFGLKINWVYLWWFGGGAVRGCKF